MNIFSALKSTFKLAFLSATILATTSLTNCGGGGGGGNKDDATIRPKTLDGLLLSMGPGAVNISFVRSASAKYANKSGQTENGAAVYTPIERIRSYETVRDIIDTIWPLFLNNDLSYTYTAINDTSGLISLTGGDGIFGAEDLTVGDYPVNLLYFAATSETYNINITFGSDGNNLTDSLARIAPDDVLLATIVDDTGVSLVGYNISDVTANDPATFTFTDEQGQPVPVNYTTETNDDEQVSGISNETLHLRTLSILSDAVALAQPAVTESGAFSFTLDQSIGGIEFDETGQANYEQPQLIVGGVTTQVGLSDSGTYTYKRILGTDRAEVRFNGAQINVTKITLDFIGKEGPFQRASGTYTIRGGLLDGDEGVFRILNEVPPVVAQ
jgi:hypothetical protein